jgi:8-oxo-dGTP diphosphatase
MRMKNVSAAIFIKDMKALITRRSPGENLAGYWEFPGGKQEPDETIFECLEREIFEEFRVTCVAHDIFAESIYQYDGGTINLIAVNAKLESDRLELTVHDKFEWVKVSDLLSYKLAPADIPIAKKLVEDYE